MSVDGMTFKDLVEARLGAFENDPKGAYIEASYMSSVVWDVWRDRYEKKLEKKVSGAFRDYLIDPRRDTDAEEEAFMDALKLFMEESYD